MLIGEYVYLEGHQRRKKVGKSNRTRNNKIVGCGCILGGRDIGGGILGSEE